MIQTFNTPTLPYFQETKIYDTTSENNLGMLLWSQKTLDEIVKNSGPLAAHNEFQIHYWALVIRLNFTDGSLIDIGLPTVVFNYEQEVTPAHIDFELKDVNEVSEAVLPIHNMVVNKIIPQIKGTTSVLDCTIEFLNVPLNTMHRHPTGVSSFSGTDLRKNHQTDTGIIFPLRTGDKTPSFSSIIYNNPVKMIHTEYRLATGDVDAHGIYYTKGECFTHVKGELHKPNMAQQLLGKGSYDTSYSVGSQFQLPVDIVSLLNSISYEVNTQLVKPEYVKKKEYKVTKTFHSVSHLGMSNNDYSRSLLVTEPTIDEQIETILNDDKAIAEINKYNYSELLTTTEVAELSLEELIIHAVKLDRFYYSDPTIDDTDYLESTLEEMGDTVIGLQANILEEYLTTSGMYETEELTLSEKEDILMQQGHKPSELYAASDEQIEQWYQNLSA